MRALFLFPFLSVYLQHSFGQTASSEPKFVEVNKAEFPAPGFLSGSSWADYDNDGWQDIFINGDSTGSDWLIQNSSLGISSNKFTLSGLPNFGVSGAWGDYNNDGWPDLFVAVGSDLSGAPEEKNDRLYRNEGNGTFKKIANSPLVTDGLNTQVGIWGDINNDGRLDLLVSTEQGLKQFTNVDGNTFTLQIPEFDIYNEAKLAMTDFDQDGDADFIASNFSGTDELIIKLNDGQALSESINNEIVGSTALIEDFDNDGRFEIITQNFTGMDIYDYDLTTKSLTPLRIETHAGSDGRTFIAAADLDNNGYIDLIGRTNHRYYPRFYMNEKNTADPQKPAFISFSNTDILGLANARTIAIADYNNDGWLDLFTMNTPDISPMAHHLFEAIPGTNHWIRIKLRGVTSNRDGIGAKIKLQYGPGIQMREIRSNSSNLSGNELIAHFGLGQETNVNSLAIEWPSGAQQLIQNPSIDQLHTIEEENNITAVEERAGVNLVYPNPAGSKIHIVSESIITTLRLTTVQGKEAVVINNLNTKEYELLIKALPEGLYVLKIFNKTGREIKKVVVKR